MCEQVIVKILHSAFAVHLKCDVICRVIVKYINHSCAMIWKITVDSQNYAITLYIVDWVIMALVREETFYKDVLNNVESK